MHYRRAVFAALVFGIFIVSDLHGQDSGPAPEKIRAAINRSIPLLEKGTQGSAEQRKCFTCHNQAVPVFALVEARNHGIAINEENLQRQLQHTAAHLERGKKKYLEGSGQGGKVFMAGYALWMLEVGGRTPDETTAAVTGFLLQYQKQANHWTHPGSRPPSSGSEFATTYVALRGLAAFGTEEQKTRIEARSAAAGKWLLSEKPAETEDRVFRLRTLKYVTAKKQVVQQAVQELLDSQRNDGGWAQTAQMKSDAYATATVLVALLEAEKTSSDASFVRRAVQYLIDAQQDDGSWHVVTRAKPFQTYYESGFPHGKDQFISITASGWATLALLLALPGKD